MQRFALYWMLFGILIHIALTDGGSLTWNEPPPTQVVQAVANPEDHFSSRQLHEGTINANLSWQFDLTELNFRSLVILFDGTTVAGVTSLGFGPEYGFVNQYDIDWIPNKNFLTLIIFSVTTEQNGKFTCRVAVHTMKGFASFQFDSNIQVDVVAPPSNIAISSDLSVTTPAELTLNCSADGIPKPTITWTRVSDGIVVTMPLNITGGMDGGGYRCTVDNGVGKLLRKDVFVDVQVPPMVKLPSKVFVGREQSASLICEVEGNPTPIISWSPCSGRSVLCDEHYLNISKVQTGCANYTCTARNAVGVDSETTLLLIGGKNVFLRLNMTGECDNKDSVWEMLQKELAGKVFTNTQAYSGAELIDIRCGSLIFDVVLKFSIEVAECDIIFIIQSAIVHGKLGELGVNVTHIIGIPPVEQSTTAAPTSTVKLGDSADPPLYIIGIVLGVAIAGGLIYWVVCRKTSKVNYDGERGDRGRRHLQLQGPDAQSGSPAANGTDGTAEQEVEVAAAIPTNTVMDQPKEKLLPEEVPPVHTEEDENLYETLDEPKKEKKPGELLYVGLDDFQNPGMPTVSISPQPLPDPHEWTDYAVITNSL
ncbi:uncharacterized protein LOC114972267 isoform X2 [Acropora millepora]|uniref:uncharacterized protein LOC114972267 isoform X2 n=1 Tax=Acropora millepora TaxID=45264 RepID=UPI001CF4E87B|nr:uncharacterized protein LOC114972267 isoform X2 [Acropora millepora]